MFEQWTCVADREGNPGCGFTLVMGIGAAKVPDKCPKCGGRAWEIKGDARQCRATGKAHQWRKGTDINGLPEIDPDQICTACGAVPVMEGVGIN